MHTSKPMKDRVRLPIKWGTNCTSCMKRIEPGENGWGIKHTTSGKWSFICESCYDIEQRNKPTEEFHGDNDEWESSLHQEESNGVDEVERQPTFLEQVAMAAKWRYEYSPNRRQ